ncbi:MAG: hypothetical protein KatS3mg105_2435 [Gemmatales bacterium]|nr:MAG: hypothetical protein KatS3mg105_2435 [Gemmatales bacterium]
MAIDTIDGFIDVLKRSRLLTEEQEHAVVTLRRSFDEPQMLAWYLFDCGLLTTYQINQLFHGNGHKLVLGDYVLLEQLGHGSVGQVFKVLSRSEQEIFALKMLRDSLVSNPEAVRQFQWEMHVIAQLEHENIIRTVETGEDEGRYYFVMEFLEGAHLARLVQQAGPLPVSLACRYTWQAARGLQHAHEHGLVHRDIKPQNLLLLIPTEEVERLAAVGWEGLADAEECAIRILDWGIAGLRLPATGFDLAEGSDFEKVDTVGTADYLAPEQAFNPREADIRADIYSLGCTMYFLLTGQPPFPEGSVLSKLLRHQREMPMPASRLRQDIPAGLEAVLNKMLAKSPDDRYSTPADLLYALEPWLDRKAPSAVAASPSVEVTPSDRRASLRHRCQLQGLCKPVNASVDITWPAEILDISRGGLALRVDRRFERGTLLDVELHAVSTHTTQHVIARVVNLRQQHDRRWVLGCAFARELADEELWAFRAERVRPPAKDCRAWIRFPCRPGRNSHLSMLNREKWPATVVNISPGGVALLVKHAVDAGTQLQLELHGNVDSPPILTLAYVVHATARDAGLWELGCAFAIELQENELDTLL